MPLAVAVPAAFAVLAVLWIFRRKSGKGGKPSGKSRIDDKGIDVSGEQHSEIVVSSCTLGVEKQGITITQRKIPETQARDRGDADLSHNAPDFTAGFDIKPAPTESPICAKIVPQEESVEVAVIDDVTEDLHSVHSEALTQVQLDQVEKMIMSAMGDGLHEATGKLMSSRGQVAHGDLGQSLSASSGIEDMDSFGQSYHDTVATPTDVLPSEKVINCSSVATIGFDIAEEMKGSDNSGSTTLEETVISEMTIKPVSVSSHQMVSEPETISEAAAEGDIQCSPQEEAAFFPSSDLHSSHVSSLSQDTEANSEQFISTDFTAQQQSSNQNSVPPPSPVFSSSLSSATSDQPLSKQEKQKPQEQISTGQNIPFTSSTSNEAALSAASMTRRRMPIMSSGSLESQASLGPEDIDSLWGIKPLSGASANWDRQLSLDDPDSPLRKSAIASESDISLPSSTPAEIEIISPSVSSLHNEQPVAAATGMLTEPVEPASATPVSKEDNATKDGKDIEQALKPNSPLCDSNSEVSNIESRVV